jgi:hypothetical protein
VDAQALGDLFRGQVFVFAGRLRHPALAA